MGKGVHGEEKLAIHTQHATYKIPDIVVFDWILVIQRYYQKTQSIAVSFLVTNYYCFLDGPGNLLRLTSI